MQDGRSAVNKVAEQIKKDCVGVALNGHMLYWLATTDGENGAFIKANRHPSGGNCFVLTTPSGRKLAGGNGGGGAAQAIREGLAEWNKLSAAERRALPDGQPAKPDELARCTPPAGGLVLTTLVRNLKRGADGELTAITADDLKDRTLYPDWNPIYTEPAHFKVWLTESEWRSLIPADAKQGDRAAMPAGIEKRLFRYHLVNGTFGLPGSWRLEDIRAGALTLIVEQTAPTLRLRIEGTALLASDADLAKANRGYDAQLGGVIEYDGKKDAITRFDMAAVGDYWGGDYEGGRFKRPGRTPLGIAFELTQGDRAVDRVPPLVHMDRKDVFDRYFAAERR